MSSAPATPKGMAQRRSVPQRRGKGVPRSQASSTGTSSPVRRASQRPASTATATRMPFWTAAETQTAHMGTPSAARSTWVRESW